MSLSRSNSPDLNKCRPEGDWESHGYRRQSSPLMVVISGPSGVGKDAVVKRMKERGYPFHFVVTATTRPPRSGEQHGVDYFFMTDAEFEHLIESDELFEHAIVYGQRKGIPKEQVRRALSSGQDVVMRLDVQGARTVHRLAPDAILIFLVASEEELCRRLQERQSETVQSMQKRMAVVREELECIPEFDYVVVNRNGCLDETVDTVAAIIKAEKCSTRQRTISI